MNILVFKTSVEKKSEYLTAKDFLDNCKEIEDWNFDLQDCDRVLRVVTPYDLENYIISNLMQLNIRCQELE